MTLASVQRIETVSPIEGADRIEKVTMENLGWECVVMKDSFKPGDLCVYIEIDTIIPKNFLADDYVGDEVVRLKTVKLKKQVSQGLILPITVFKRYVSHLDFYPHHIEFTDGTGEWKTLGMNVDISEPLGVKKYEKAIPSEMQGLAKGNFPSFVSKTDEPMLQSSPKLWDALKAKKGIYVTLKIDGTSSTNYFRDEFGVCSRNMDLKRGSSLYWRVAEELGIESKLPNTMALQGEIFGPNLSKNPLGVAEHKFNVFNVWYLRYDGPATKMYFPECKGFTEGLGLEFVPVILTVDSYEELPFHDVESAIEYAKTLKYPNGHMAEGMVVRSFDQLISFKVINNNYLLKYEE